MNNTINDTLRTKLITNPKPVCSKREFWHLYSRIICDSEVIEEFLKTEDTVEKFSLAQRIFLRMSFESNFPPSIAIESFIGSFESEIRTERSIPHQSRDHYIHQCYLYLLGLYAFFYNRDLNSKLLGYFSHTKYSKGHEHSKAVKSFISGWKYFVLYHDLAYPFEYLGSKSHDYSKIREIEL